MTKNSFYPICIITLALSWFCYVLPAIGQTWDLKDEENEVIETKYHIIRKGDTLHKLARNYDLGFDELLQANPQIIDQHQINLGEKLTIPTIHLLPDVKHEGIVINLAELRLYFFLDENEVISFPISIGTEEKTPVGKTTIARMTQNPSWIPTASIREENPQLPQIVPPGPDNPLGNYAIYLAYSNSFKWLSIAIHGTNVPTSIGSRVSHGCIRLYPEDIQTLFNNVEVGMPVTIINQPFKVEELGRKIYFESHLREAPELVMERMGVRDLICKKIKNCDRRVNWYKVEEAVVQNLGVPVLISGEDRF